jgi:hypothetical protein
MRYGWRDKIAAEGEKKVAMNLKTLEIPDNVRREIERLQREVKLLKVEVDEKIKGERYWYERAERLREEARKLHEEEALADLHRLNQHRAADTLKALWMLRAAGDKGVRGSDLPSWPAMITWLADCGYQVRSTGRGDSYRVSLRTVER